MGKVLLSPMAERTLRCIELRLAVATELLGVPSWDSKPHHWLSAHTAGCALSGS